MRRHRNRPEYLKRPVPAEFRAGSGKRDIFENMKWRELGVILYFWARPNREPEPLRLQFFDILLNEIRRKPWA